MLVAADAVRSCWQQQRMIDRVLCIWRILSSIIFRLSHAGSFCSATPLIRVAANSVTWLIPPFPFHRAVTAAGWGTFWLLYLWELLTVVITSATTYSEGGSATHPDMTQNSASCNTATAWQPVLGSINFGIYNYVVTHFPFEDFWCFLCP